MFAIKIIIHDNGYNVEDNDFWQNDLTSNHITDDIMSQEKRKTKKMMYMRTEEENHRDTDTCHTCHSLYERCRKMVRDNRGRVFSFHYSWTNGDFTPLLGSACQPPSWVSASIWWPLLQNTEKRKKIRFKWFKNLKIMTAVHMELMGKN